MVAVDASVTLSSAATSILSGVFLVLAGTSTVTVGLLDAVSACFVLNTPVAPATAIATRATSAMDNPAVRGLWNLTHLVSLFIKNLILYKLVNKCN